MGDDAESDGDVMGDDAESDGDVVEDDDKGGKDDDNALLPDED